MKTCPNCWCMNNDEAENCQKCGTKFALWEGARPLPVSNEERPKFSDPISTTTKWRFWLGAWGFVILASVMASPASILAAPFFPIGLLFWLPNGEDKAIKGGMMEGWVFGWMFYLLLSLVMFQIMKRGVFFIIFAIFCILLALNIGGCQRILKDVSHIQ